MSAQRPLHLFILQRCVTVAIGLGAGALIVYDQLPWAAIFFPALVLALIIDRRLIRRWRRRGPTSNNSETAPEAL